MSPSRAEIVTELIAAQRLFAIVRTDSKAKALAAAEAILDAGVKLVKITFTIPGALDVLEALASRRGAVPGAGSVTTMEETVEAVERGAYFIVCPHIDRAIIDYCRDNDVYIAAGALTPTEAMTAHLAGVDIIKVYPVKAMGGPSYIRYLLTPMPFLRLAPVGGIEVDEVEAYLQAGAVAIGAGSPMVHSEFLERKDYESIRNHAREFLALTSVR